MPDATPEQVTNLARAELAKVYTPEGVELWLQGSKRSFGGVSPAELIQSGHGQQVLQRIAQLVDGTT